MRTLIPCYQSKSVVSIARYKAMDGSIVTERPQRKSRTGIEQDRARGPNPIAMRNDQHAMHAGLGPFGKRAFKKASCAIHHVEQRFSAGIGSVGVVSYLPEHVLVDFTVKAPFKIPAVHLAQKIVRHLGGQIIKTDGLT